MPGRTSHMLDIWLQGAPSACVEGHPVRVDGGISDAPHTHPSTYVDASPATHTNLTSTATAQSGACRHAHVLQGAATRTSGWTRSRRPPGITRSSRVWGSEVCAACRSCGCRCGLAASAGDVAALRMRALRATVCMTAVVCVRGASPSGSDSRSAFANRSFWGS